MTSPSSQSMSQELARGTSEEAHLIEQLLAVGNAFFASRDLGELLDLILTKSREITYSDAGSIYLVDRSDGVPKLIFKVAQNDSKPNLSLEEFAIPLTQQSIAGYVALTGESLNWPDVYNLPEDIPYRFDHRFDVDIDYRTRSVVALPMQNQEGDVIGVLQLINRKRQMTGVINEETIETLTQPYSEWEERVARSLAGQAAVSIERNQLQRSIDTLFQDLESPAYRPSPNALPRYVQAVIDNDKPYIITNLVDGRTQVLFQSEGIWSLGRGTKVSIPIDDQRLSRHHAVIRYSRLKGFYLIDLDSANGTYIDDLKIREPYILRDGDRIRLANTVFMFFVSQGVKTLTPTASGVLEKLSKLQPLT